MMSHVHKFMLLFVGQMDLILFHNDCYAINAGIIEFESGECKWIVKL